MPQSAEHGNCTHKKICSRSTCTPKIRPCTRAFYGYRINIGPPGLSYHLKPLGAPERIRCARRAPPIFYLARARSRRVLPCSADWLMPDKNLKFFCIESLMNCYVTKLRLFLSPLPIIFNIRASHTIKPPAACVQKLKVG